MSAPERHGWTRSRLAALVAGLLTEEEEATAREHLATCPDCRVLHDLLADEGDDPERGEHIPAAILGRWRVAKESLRGIERSMVRLHLERCEECRRGLELLGHESRLEPAGAPRAQSIPIPPALGPRAGSNSEPPRPRPRELNWRGVFTWRTYALAATVAWMGLALSRSQSPLHDASSGVPESRLDVSSDRPPDRPGGVFSTPTSGQPGLPAPPAQPSGSQRAPMPVRAPRIEIPVVASLGPETRAGGGASGNSGPSRGSASPEDTLGIEPTLLAPETESILVMVADLGLWPLPADAPLEVMLLSPGGRLLARNRCTFGELTNRGYILLTLPKPSPGVYAVRVRFRATGSAPPDSVERPWVLQVRQGKR